MKRLLVPLWMRLALNAYAASDYQKAERYFRRIHEVDPQRRGVRHNLALTAMGRGDFAAAEPLFLAELEAQGDYYPRLRILADLYYAWGRHAAAAEYYRRAAADPDAPDIDGWFLRERLRICTDPQSAEASVRSNALYHEGAGLLAAGDPERALGCFRESFSLDPTNHPALNNIGVILMNTHKDYEGAAAVFEQAHRIQPVEIVRANLARARAMIAEKTRKARKER